MDTDFLSFLFNSLLFVGVLIAFKDRGKINDLIKKVGYLQKVVELQATQINKLTGKVAPESYPETLAKVNTELAPEDKTRFAKSDSQTQTALLTKSGTNSESADVRSTSPNPWQNRAKVTNSKSQFFSTTTLTKSNWNLDFLLKGKGIFWLGAAVLAMGGIFLAKYSIEAGILPPSIRVIIGAMFGVVLVVAAELINHYKDKFNVQTPYISAAIASGGIVTCFAMALVSFDVYHFITPDIAFILLAFISLVATYLALRFGPVLAGIGIIGSYAVPALVSTGANNVIALVLYISFVSISAVWVAGVVKQKWLWWQSFIGHFVWFAALIIIGNQTDYLVVLAYALVSIYLFALVDVLGWRLDQASEAALTVKQLIMPKKEIMVFLFSLVFTAIYLSLYNELNGLILASIIFCCVSVFVCYRHSAFDFLPFVLLGFGLYVFTLMPDVVNFEDNLFPFIGKYLFIQLSVIVAIAFSLLMSNRFPKRYAYLILLVAAPISLYAISYITSSSQAEAFLYPLWALEILFVAATAAVGASKTKDTMKQVTYLVLSNAMLTLCFTMLFAASTLTIVLTMQVASMSYLSWKYGVKIPDWIYKIALVMVVSRLTLAPWLASYKDELLFNVHWTLVVYPAVLAIVWFATKYNPSKALNAWFLGVFIHIVALLVTTETSYMLIGRYPDLTDLSYKESIVLAFNWLILAGVYLWRSRLTQMKNMLYKVAAYLLISGTAIIHFDISVINNPFIENHFVGSGVINWMALQWLLPSAVLFAFVKFKLLPAQFNRLFYSLMAIFIFVFINGEIRNMFNDGYVLWGSPLQQAELYTYSIVWLVISTLVIFCGKYVNKPSLINSGFIGLALVILKAFGVDMSHLEGLLRALSFIGLGLCLVAIGWLFQKIQPNRGEASEAN